jgi:putative colanic acid biosynthesis glycosyltransferase
MLSVHIPINRPLVSVITVVFNGEKTIEDTINSVGFQDYPNIEYIICDGNSTDSTVDIIQRNSSIVSNYISEPDRGVYDAMNKAIGLATGEWLIFLGCDDCLADSSSIGSLVDAICEETMLVYGNIQYTNGKNFVSKLNRGILIGNTVHHQASLYRKSLFDNFSYDTNYKICSDYELNLLIYLQKYKFSYTNKMIAICGTDGLSAQQKNTGNEEINCIRGKHINIATSFLMSLIQRVWRLLYTVRSQAKLS